MAPGPSITRPAAPRNNASLLTDGARYFARAKKNREERVEKVVFDDAARREYLTGFSKRKKQKTEERRQKAKARDHAEHLEERKKARQALKQRALDNVRAVRKAMGLETSDDEGAATASAIAGPSSRAGETSAEVDAIREQEEEFSDDEQHAVVTIVEDFDPSAPSTSTLTAPPAPPPSIPLLPASSRKQQKKAATLSAADKQAAKRRARLASDRSFETKAERRKGRELEMKRRTKKAELAREREGMGPPMRGGKGARGGRGGGRGGRGGKRGGRGGKK